MTAVALREVSLVYPDGTIAVDDVSLSARDGEFLVLLGPSGCGKSSILRMVAGLQRPTRGQVILGGRPADDIPARSRGVSMVFQDFALYPHLTVADNIGFPLDVSGCPQPERAERITQVAKTFGIDDLLGRRPAELSGGQRQRAAMARAIVREPRVLLMDEPLSNLDAVLRSGLRAEIAGLARSLGLTVLYVTHDQIEAQTMADRIAVLRNGVLEDEGRPDEVYRHPATMHVAAFLGSPRMSLIKAYVRVVVDSHVELHIGEQVIDLPWPDMRARAVAHYDGEDIALGARTEALSPAPPGASGSVLTGQVRHLEHHGHETLVAVDVGAVPVQPCNLDELHTGELVLRVRPDVRPVHGEHVGIRLRLEQLHFFDLANGRRIGPRGRRPARM